MKRQTILYIMLLFFLGELLFATSICDQTLKLVALVNQETPTFYIFEELSGECLQLRLHKITLSKESYTNDFDVHYITKLNDEGVENLQKGIAQPILQLSNESPQNIEFEDGAWKIDNLNWSMMNPDINDDLLDKAIKLSPLVGSIWFEQYGMDGIMLPEFRNIETELVYFHPRGLYVNYDITDVYYFPKN